MTIKRFLLKQYDTGPWLGGLKSLYNGAMGYQAMISFFLIALTAYNTLLLREEFRGIASFINFPTFIAVLLCILIGLMIFVYKVEVPSLHTYANLQVFKHHNLLRKQIDDMEKSYGKKLDLILQKLEKLEKAPEKRQ